MPKTAQNLTPWKYLTDEAKSNCKTGRAAAEPAQDLLVTWRALDGLWMDDDGSLSKISLSGLASRLGYHRQTMYDWENSIPNFNDRVEERRKLLFTQRHESAIWKAMFLKAIEGSVKHAEMVLSHFSGYIPPSAKACPKCSKQGTGLADLMNAARK